MEQHVRPAGASERISKPEKEILDFLTGLGLNVEHSNRTILNNRQEIDFYLPEKKIGIEYNGIYWHSEAAGRSEQYHHSKWVAANKAGFQLLQLWEDDWRDRKLAVMRTLAHTLGMQLQLDDLRPFNTEIGRTSIQDTKIVSLTIDQARDFLNECHIQGFISGSHYIGLEDSMGTIRSVMVLQEQTNHIINILRYSTFGIYDGFSKILGYAEQTYKPASFIALADNCTNNADIYSENGFIIDQDIAPDYTYLFKAERKPKSDYTMERFRDDPTLNWEEGLTEIQLAELNKMHRVWDAGMTRYRKDC